MKNKRIGFILILAISILLLKSPDDVAWGKSSGQTVPTLGPSRTPTSTTQSPINSLTPTRTPTLHSTVTSTFTNTEVGYVATLVVPSATPSPVITLLESAVPLTSVTLETKISVTQTPTSKPDPNTTESGGVVITATQRVVMVTSTIVKSEEIVNEISPPGWVFPVIGSILLIVFLFSLRSVFQKNNKKS